MTSRVRLLNAELSTRSAARSRMAKLFVLFESAWEMLSGLCTQARPPFESRAPNSVCCLNKVCETIPIVRVVLGGAVGFLHLTRVAGATGR
eukprot:5757943-Pyramimonas_sp.AAC.1